MGPTRFNLDDTVIFIQGEHENKVASIIKILHTGEFLYYIVLFKDNNTWICSGEELMLLTDAAGLLYV